MSATKPISVLFLCQKNSARSQMAEAFLRRLGGARFEVHSAGLEESRIHPLTRQVMQEAGFDLAQQRSKSAQEYLGKATFAYVVTVCDVAQRDCPRLFPGALRHLFWPFPDPIEINGTQEERLQGFRAVRDAIRTRIALWLESAESAAEPGRQLPAH